MDARLRDENSSSNARLSGLKDNNLVGVDGGSVGLSNLLPDLATLGDEVDVDNVEDLVEGIGARAGTSSGARNGTSVSADGAGLSLLSLEDLDSVFDLVDSSFAFLDLSGKLDGRSSGSLDLESLESLLGLLDSLGASGDLNVVSVDNDGSLGGDGLDTSEGLDVLLSASLDGS